MHHSTPHCADQTLEDGDATRFYKVFECEQIVDRAPQIPVGLGRKKLGPGCAAVAVEALDPVNRSTNVEVPAERAE